MNSENDRIAQLRQRSARIGNDRSSLTAYKRFESIGDDLDTTLNFKLNSGLKAEFEKICKQHDSNVSRELKRYMRASVIAGELL
ncbi:hypothetical protein V2J88_09520 [Pseudomonas alliivorans]|nr:hypothetical protein [Pseudomonas alliivorans]